LVSKILAAIPGKFNIVCGYWCMKILFVVVLLNYSSFFIMQKCGDTKSSPNYVVLAY